MVTGGFVVALQHSITKNHYKLTKPLGLHYMQDESGRVQPNLLEWVWGADIEKPVLIDRNKITSISYANARMIGLYIEYNSRITIAKQIAAEFVKKLEQQKSSENKPSEDVVNQRFPGETEMTSEEQIGEAMKFKEFTKPPIH